MNIPSKESRELEVEQEEAIFFGERLEKGYTLTWHYVENGKNKIKEQIIYSNR